MWIWCTALGFGEQDCPLKASLSFFVFLRGRLPLAFSGSVAKKDAGHI
jgi:hypothetical protein